VVVQVCNYVNQVQRDSRATDEVTVDYIQDI